MVINGIFFSEICSLFNYAYNNGEEKRHVLLHEFNNLLD